MWQLMQVPDTKCEVIEKALNDGFEPFFIELTESVHHNRTIWLRRESFITFNSSTNRSGWGRNYHIETL